MAFGKTTFTLLALVSATALVTSVGCSDDSTNTTLGTGGNGTGGQGTGATGGNGTGGEGTGATGGNGTGGSGMETDCATYCADNITNCADANKQWDTTDPTPQETCEAWCTVWDQGTVGEMSGDTLECRAYHTGAAASDAATHCPHSGPLGGGVCGASQCEVFCAAMQLICTGNDAQYASEAECLTDCGGLADKDTPFTANAGEMTNALACRAYHLSAALDSPSTHCGHAAGESICP